MVYINELKVQVENRFGKKIESKADAQVLKNKIFLFQKEYLSESTIRRFFNLIPAGNISKTTLDIFSRYIGFENYNHFSAFCDQLILNVMANNSDQALLNALISKSSFSLFEINLVCNRIVQMIKDENFELLHMYFNHDTLFSLVKANKSIHDLFAQTLGPHFASEYFKFEDSDILSTKYFIPLVLHNYVDISNSGLEKFYFKIVQQPIKPQDLIFAASMLALNYHLNNQQDKAVQYYHLIDKSIIIESAPLAGRIALLDLIFKNDFDALLQTAQKFRDTILYFSLDIIPYLIYKKNIERLKLWFATFPDMMPQNKSWVEKDLLDMLEIAKWVADDNKEELKKIMRRQTKMMNSLHWFNLALKTLD
jgi:hypothetical protein